MDGFLRGERRFDLLHPVDLLELALRLRSLAGLGAEAVGEFLERGDFLLLVFVRGELLFLAGGAFEDVFVPVATVAIEPLVGDLDDGADERVEEFAVMRDHQNRAGIIAQIFLKPDERFEVEVVGRFVQQQQVGFHHQQTGQVRAHHPAAAQRLGRTLEVRRAERQSRQDALGFGLELPAVVLVENAEGFVVFGGIFWRGFQDALGFGQFRRDGAGEFQHRLVARRSALLREVADGGCAFERDPAFVSRSLAQDQRKERRFARAVGADQSHSVATVHLKRGVFKKDAAAKTFAELRNR